MNPKQNLSKCGWSRGCSTQIHLPGVALPSEVSNSNPMVEDFAPIMGLVGAFAGLYAVRREKTNETYTADTTE